MNEDAGMEVSNTCCRDCCRQSTIWWVVECRQRGFGGEKLDDRCIGRKTHLHLSCGAERQGEWVSEKDGSQT